MILNEGDCFDSYYMSHNVHRKASFLCEQFYCGMDNQKLRRAGDITCSSFSSIFWVHFFMSIDEVGEMVASVQAQILV